ncbi:hypothetical protein MMC13_004787 [Lambiella insularis]|nr:hypothetical protein [Lambiella insularis]
MEDEPILDFGSAFDSPTFAKDGSFEVDRPVGSMSISPCGRDVVLASRQGLHIIDLDSPWATPRHLPHHTPWEVADVQWSPFPSRDFWVVSTSNQKALVWNLAMPTPGTSVEHVLHAHSRAITDINFSAHHPDVLATCAVDSFVHCWDLRYPAKPALTFCDWFAGATQVKWNRQDAHIIASSHDKILRIWDDRKGAHPLRSIEAHDTKIYGVDWNRTQAHRVATCSLDKTIKFWDYTSAQDVPERIIATPFPVWRARHTPFGCGMLAMPQRGDHDLHMYDRRMGANMESIEDVSPVHRFQGHQDQVKEFLWRSRGAVNAGIDDREFQLVSWGADRVLRLHYVDQNLLKEVGYEKGKEVDEKLNLTRKNALYKTYREDAVSHSDSDTVQSSIIGAHFSAEMGVETDVHGIKGESMSAGPLPSAGAWVDGDFLTSRPGMRNRIATRVDIDPISWMKGVKIGKRDGQLEQSFASVSSPNFKADGNWIDFESLGEEITHVGALFRKADFHEINVKDRFVKVALYGPWGPSDSSTYLDCRLAFPTNYPNNATIAFSVEKTATVDAGIASRLGTDVEKIGSAYLAVGRGSLEAVIRYLHGEQTLEELITWATGEQGDTISVFPNDGDSSSSDEDDTLGAFLGDQNDDQEHATGVLSSSNANANVPLPKACGALWADDGRLICFFPPKEEKPQTLLGSLGLQGNDLLARKGKKAFDGFGDFQIRAPITKTKLSSVETTTSEDLDSDFDSDTSYSSSSRSSNSSEDMEISRQRLDHPYIYTGDTIQRSIAIDGSQLSSGILSLSRSGAPNAKTILSIHNLEDLLPAKSSLAKEYLLRGPSASKHNADIASRQGLSVLADVWHLLDILTRNEVPLDAIVDAQKHLSFLLPTPSSISSLTRGDSAIDLSFDAKLRDDHQGFMAAVSWGQHPMGNGYLINAL